MSFESHSSHIKSNYQQITNMQNIKELYIEIPKLGN